MTGILILKTVILISKTGSLYSHLLQNWVRTVCRQQCPFFCMLTNDCSSLFLLGVEKKNDDCRHIHLQKSNKWDASKDVLLVLKRQERLSNFERTPRQYNKTKAAYWENDIKEKWAKQLVNIRKHPTCMKHK